MSLVLISDSSSCLSNETEEKNDIIPFTVEQLNWIKENDRNSYGEALRVYHDWLERQRKTDRDRNFKQVQKIRSFQWRKHHAKDKIYDFMKLAGFRKMFSEKPKKRIRVSDGIRINVAMWGKSASSKKHTRDYFREKNRDKRLAIVGFRVLFGENIGKYALDRYKKDTYKLCGRKKVVEHDSSH